MITHQDLQAAIAECLGERNPNANTCIKLAAYYTIQNELYGQKPTADPEPATRTAPESFGGYSFAAPSKAETTIEYHSDTELGRRIEGRKAADVWPLIDELVETVRVVNPRLYAAFFRKLD